ncbi:hypothetical protein [Soonwooa sp.]|uniref:hypothetical protein n=1 Tax=Soonwooa sp. TaxID=1938592 RepID=UPI0028A79DD3|nr:hypothetical protein [Soonwooa sp.]
MLRSKYSILLLFGITLFPITQASAQLGQITSVISIASKYATLLKSNRNDFIYADENVKNEIDEHVNIAIIPF